MKERCLCVDVRKGGVLIAAIADLSFLFFPVSLRQGMTNR